MTIDEKYIVGFLIGATILGLSFWDLSARYKAAIKPESKEAQTSDVSASPEDTAANGENSGANIPSPSPKPSVKPSLKPSFIPSPSPSPISDYFPGTIHIGGSETDGVTMEETSSLRPFPVSVLFQNNEKISGPGTIKVKVYYDSVFKTEIAHETYGNTGATFIYYPDIDPGSHTVRFVINEDRSVAESNYGNNERTLHYTINGDKVSPNFSIEGPFPIDAQTCMRVANLTDNVSVYTDVWYKWKIDDGNWSGQCSGTDNACITAVSGSSHTYYVHAEDRNGNVKEDSRTFTGL